MPDKKPFDSNDRPLLDVLKEIEETKVQLPDFQRGWIWDDDHIRSLLASISNFYPVGAVMVLKTGNPGVKFKPRIIEGIDATRARAPEKLILDGQQRLTSLFLALKSGCPVETTDHLGNKIKRWYYIDMQQAMDPDSDREEAIVSLPEDKKKLNFRGEVVEDYSSDEREYKALLFPLSQVFSCSAWRRNYNVFWNHDPEKSKFFDDFEEKVVANFRDYQLPVITLSEETNKDAVCLIFEKVNTGGVPLTVFELLTAMYASEEYNLREDWSAREKRLKKNRVLGNIENTEFLQTVCLLSTRSKRVKHLMSGAKADDAPAVGCKRKDILRMTLDEYKQFADLATEGFEKAGKLLFSQKIFASRDIPYKTQIVPVAAVLAALGGNSEKDGVRAKVLQWYWCGVFGELYGSATETRFAKDLPEALEWVNGGPEPTTVSDANFVSDRLLSLRTRNSAAYKGLYAILLRDGCLDFLSGEPIDVQTYFDDRIDIHHVFPQKWCETNAIGVGETNSVINKTPLSARTNRIIGRKAPSSYLELLEKRAKIPPERMNEILESHLIEPKKLRADDFKYFFEERKKVLLQFIATAMGKAIIGEAQGLPLGTQETQS